jgi:hypothetical protein
MEVDKVEKHIKEQLNNRVITPSEAAWEKLSGQLPKADKKKSNTFVWYSLAASFIGILLITTIYLANQDELENTEIEVVDAPKEPITIPKSEEVLSEKYNVEEQLVEAENEVKTTKETFSVKQDFSAIKDKSEFVVVQKTDKIDIESKAVQTKTEELIDAKIAELIRQVDIMEDNNLQVTDLEVDSLLQNAGKEILSDKIRDQGGKINAMALLDQAESELDQTFRAQIFESLKEGFLKVRTAVADRNN